VNGVALTSRLQAVHLVGKGLVADLDLLPRRDKARHAAGDEQLHFELGRLRAVLDGGDQRGDGLRLGDRLPQLEADRRDDA
jgi:hypothetical protein